MTIPIVPSVAMNANASGMPAKLRRDAGRTSSSTVRTNLGVPSRIAEYAIRKPSSAAEQGGDEADLDRCS